MQGDMNDQQRNLRPSEPSAELELTNYQHRAEKLAFENKMLRAVLDSMPDNVSIKDLQGRYIFDNSSHCRFLGATNTPEGRALAISVATSQNSDGCHQLRK